MERNCFLLDADKFDSGSILFGGIILLESGQ